MTNKNTLYLRHRLLVMVALFFLVANIYMLTYNGKVMFNDELQMMDTTGSIVDFGDERYDLAVWYVWTNYGALGQDTTPLYPLPSSPIEPGLSITATPLYILAKMFALGRVHVVWVLNVLVGASTPVLMFQYSLLLGYKRKTAFASALVIAFCTVLFPYSRTFLREPLTLFLLLFAAYVLEQARVRKNWILLGAGFIGLAAAFYTKENVVAAIPGILLILFPNIPRLNQLRYARRVMLVGLTFLLTIPLILIYTSLFEKFVDSPIPLFGQYTIQTEYLKIALHSYLLSIGGSIWGTSPILLLAIPGSWVLIKQNRWRYIWVMISTVVLFSVAHALTVGPNWSGGATWPPRFMIPLIPFILLCALPAIENALDHLSRLTPLVMFAGFLVVYSLWWQISGVSLSWYEYGNLLPQEAGGLIEWLPGLNRLEYIRPVLLTPLLFEKSLDFAWVRNQNILWCVLFLAGASVAAYVVLKRSIARPILYIGILVLLFVLSVGWGLHQIVYDSAFRGDNPALKQMASIIDDEEEPGDIVLLNTPDYHLFFMNYGDFDEARIVTLPLAPGERGSFEEETEIPFDDPADLMEPSTDDLIDALMVKRDRIWLLMETGPYLPWSIRPIERYLTAHYYPIREINTNPPDVRIRLLEFSTVHAPVAHTLWEHETAFSFGHVIRLHGYTLPAGTDYAPGEVIPITLYWEAEASVEKNYSVALFIASDEGIILSQGQDSMPSGGFTPTLGWGTGEIVQDNRAIRLPDSPVSGNYRFWIRLYESDSAGLKTLSVSGGETLDPDIAVLPEPITLN